MIQTGDQNPEISKPDDVLHCAKHPKIETGLRCASCGTPICPKCMVVTPVGMKCSNCASNRGSHLFKVSPQRLFLAGLASLIAGAVGGLIGSFGLLLIFFVSASYGYFAGNIILRASGMKRGLKLEIIAGMGMLLGGFGFRLMIYGGFIAALINPWFLIALGVSTACAVSKIRYL